MRRGSATPLVVVTLAALGGCHDDAWQAASGSRAPDSAVTRALGDYGRGTSDLAADHVAKIDPPGALRPCCAFGSGLQVETGRVPIPGVEVGDVTGRERLGPHRYGNGFVSLHRHDPHGWFDDEGNGVVYTCRGGFLDTARVRDNADLTLACASNIARLMDRGGTFAFPSEGATIVARIEAVDPGLVERHGRRELVVSMARWLDFQVSTWHEIATWYGYAAIAGWPEKISAFSPEDLYSSLVGGRIAGGIVEAHGVSGGDEYDRDMDAWIQQVGKRLGALPMAESRRAMESVDGTWWDSSRRAPDWQLVRRRDFDIGPVVVPWLVTDATPRPAKAFDGCPPGTGPLALRAPDGFEGMAFHDWITLEIEVGDQLATSGFPFPRPGSRAITQDDFPFVVAAARRENAAAFGAPADAP